MQKVPSLVGASGHFKDEVFPLEYGKTISVGRSRGADFSLRRTRTYRAQSEPERDQDVSARTVSSKHFEVTVYNLTSIEIKNLSRNGIQVDGEKVDVIILNDVPKKVHEIRFGADEILKLEMRVNEEL